MPQRSVCRALFLLLCIGPTLAVAGWTVGRAAGSWEARRLAAVGWGLGVRVDYASASTPRPGVLRVAGLSLRDPERTRELARVDRLEARHTADGLLIDAGELRLAADELQAVGARIAALVEAGPPGAARLRVDRLTIDDGPPREWRRVQVALSEDDARRGRELTLTAHAPGNRRPSRVIVSRNRQVEPPATRIAIETGPEGVDAAALADFFDPGGFPAGVLAKAGVIVGEATVLFGAEVSGELAGELRGVVPPRGGDLAVDLDQPATVWIERLRWSGERMVELRASAAAGGGRASRSLIVAAHRGLRCGPGASLQAEFAAPTDSPIAFDELALWLELDESGLRLRGGCRDASGRAMPCLLARGGEPLLYHSSEDRLAAAALLRFVAPPDAALRPAGELPDALDRMLPMPASDTPLRVQR